MNGVPLVLFVEPRFPMGHLTSTPGALAALVEADQHARIFLERHLAADWGDLDSEDKEANDRALEAGERLLSAYRTKTGVKLWIITEADRSATTLLLPHEY